MLRNLHRLGWARTGCASALALYATLTHPAIFHGSEPLVEGFAVDTYAEGLVSPTALEFAPDGRLFIAQKDGAVRLVEAGRLQEAPVLDLVVWNFGECGLLGLALDPGFTINHYVYLFATVSHEEQQIIRFTERDGRAQDVVVIRPHLPTTGGFHNGGGLKFGPDGKLYFSIGDNISPANAQNLTTLAGKVCRINSDGSTPDDNPFRTPNGEPRAIFALGLRNPFRFCFAPDGRLFVLDVGSNGDARREEINLLRAGDNAGWSVVEGIPSPPRPEFVLPIWAYRDGGACPTGAAYYTGDHFPEAYRGDLFHLEYTLNLLYRLDLDGDVAVAHQAVARVDGGPTDLVQGPDGALFWTELNTGRVGRLSHVSGGTPGGGDPPGGGGGGGLIDPPILPWQCGSFLGGLLALPVFLACVRLGQVRRRGARARFIAPRRRRI